MQVIVWTTRFKTSGGSSLIWERSILSDLRTSDTIKDIPQVGTADLKVEVAKLSAPFDPARPYAKLPIDPLKIDAFAMSVKRKDGTSFSPISVTVKLNDSALPDFIFKLTHALGYGWATATPRPSLPFAVPIHTLFVTSAPPPAKYKAATFDFHYVILHRVP